MARDKLSGETHSGENEDDSGFLDRRDYLKLTGASAAALGGIGAGASSVAAVTEGGPENQDEWTLAFEDTFDSGSLDTSNWGVGFGWGMETNASPESISEEYVNITDGQLRIGASPDNGIEAGAVNTKDKQYFGPGSYWEAKIKFPKRVGFLPAFWAKPNSEAWPPEIDFVELFQTDGSSSDYTQSHHHIHYSSDTQPNGPHEDDGASYDVGDDLTENFHIYGCEWQEDAIRHYVDGQLVAERTADTIVESCNNGAPFYMMFTIHIDRVGTTDKSANWDEEMVVDWARVWEYGNDGSSDGGSDDGSNGDDSDNTDGSEEDSSGDDSEAREHYLWLRSEYDGGEASFEFSASGGNIDLQTNFPADYTVSDDRTSASGTVTERSNDLPGFWYDGQITEFDYSGPLQVFIDNQYVDPDTLPETESDGRGDTEGDEDEESGSSLPNTLTIDASGSSGTANYELSVSGSLEADSGASSEASVSDGSASGSVSDGQAVFGFEGELEGLSLDGDADVLVNERPVQLLRVQRADDSNGLVKYIVESTGRLLKADVPRSSINPDDQVSGGKIFGKVVGGTDAYWLLEGEITDISTFGGDVVTTLDGAETDFTN
ncbi:family 16 glycosylhydrolase [Haloprofundus sp. MHR1]|uniref:glycoside hydrolase family 16 protein n=1 Tax=Haloprofundus sp. MHR1 TaxID=2572921 RepID=UPI0010BF1B7F|nr:glycoside hydrolase family 16 protein [Haloprofundus sp. MHR1]QCJ47429.1 glycoside hydrolase family 16 protein [Haloprofundus sp. MHR1]